MYFISAFLILFLLVSCTQEPAQQIEIRGVYGIRNRCGTKVINCQNWVLIRCLCMVVPLIRH
ncbi:MAG: hypothetical protein FD181_1732 [Prolixibacteraceae bacterium]|nr:MAG: hypothetical protein FD181_1732 [Prolixibacteraceae bacterium]